MKSEWISVKDKLPDGGEYGQEVLIYYDDIPYEVHQIGILTYFKKGDLMEFDISTNIRNDELRLLDSIMNPINEITANEDGFYIYEGDRGWRKHADIITHWMPLPDPPEVKE